MNKCHRGYDKLSDCETRDCLTCYEREGGNAPEPEQLDLFGGSTPLSKLNPRDLVEEIFDEDEPEVRYYDDNTNVDRIVETYDEDISEYTCEGCKYAPDHDDDEFYCPVADCTGSYSEPQDCGFKRLS